MIIYIEKQALKYPQTDKIINKFKDPSIIIIDNYKNIFDKNIWWYKTEKSIIIARLTWKPIWKTPPWYGHSDNSYFFKTSINCIFNCSYCFLKWAFKNSMMLFFVNYDDIKSEIEEIIMENGKIKNKPSLSTEGFNPLDNHGEKIQDRGLTTRFYSSDYSDILAMDDFSNFCEEFIPFFEKFENVMMEIRTKSNNILPLLSLWFIPENTEIAFSLNPQSLIKSYEKWTPNLDARIEAINNLLDKWFKVGLRFLPLLPVKNYKNIYSDFIRYIKSKIDLEKISSIFISGLLYTKRDYSSILKKHPDLDVLYMLEKSDDDFYRVSEEIKREFYEMFSKMDGRSRVCLEGG